MAYEKSLKVSFRPR